MQGSSPNPEYLKLLEEKRQYLKKLYPLEDRNNWLKEASNGGVIIHSIYEEKSGLKIIRAQTKIKAPKEMVTAAAEEIDIIMQWDNTLESIKSHYKSEDYYIIQMVIKKLPLVVQRETVLVCKFFPEDNGVIFGVGTSIDHPSVEKVKNRIRASAYLVGWVLETDPKNPEYTIFTLILHVNPEGWIPKTVFNWFVYSQGFNIAQFGEYVEKKYKESK